MTRLTTRSRGSMVTTRSSWFGTFRIRPRLVAPRKDGRTRGASRRPAATLNQPPRDPAGRRFCDLLADALVARHRARITEAPELMLLRETWDGRWARAEADQLMAYLRAAMDDRTVGHEGDGQRILQEAAT